MTSTGDFAPHDTRCGCCGFTFEALMPRARASTLRWRDSDQCPHYEGPNPVWYAAWVCPSCHFAAYQEEFAHSPGKWRDAVSEALAAGAPSAQAVAFDQGARGLFAALTSYQLALTCYTARQAPPETLGGVALRAGWICRYARELRREIGFLAKARDHYLEAFERGARRDAQLDDLAIAYLLGELLLRTGRIADAGPYFGLVAGARESSANLKALAAERGHDARRAERTRAWLDEIPMFAPLGERGRSLLAVHGAERSFKPGVAIVTRGEPGEAMFVVMAGKIELHGAESGRPEPQATLGPGDTFGEMALFTGDDHLETAVVREPARSQECALLLEIDATVFRNLVKAVPDVALRVAVGMARRYARAGEIGRTETLAERKVV